MSFKADIEKLIESNLKTYIDNSDRFIADYNREMELTKEYNGRQLLELLQNADDAASDEVLINWDKEILKLSISNKGEPFEAGGIKSLMLANLSTKTKINYIGNKGLGFRSILNWAEQIVIKSNYCFISFSEDIANDVFENQLNLSAQDKKQLKADRNLTDETVPFPILAIPTIRDNVNKNDWTTTIEIIYRKEFEEDIEKQLLEIKEEILLFLNNVQKISIYQNGETTIELISNKEENDKFEIVSIQNKNWRVFSFENELPPNYQDKTKNERQSYSLKVAFQNDLSDSYNKLFNFFPTQLSISLPCIIHGTFELNSSRNHLNESKKNEFILEQLVELLTKCALYLTTEQIDWKAYKLLTPALEQSDSKLIVRFYEKLKEAKLSSFIYPCISNQYLPFGDIVYYNDDFNSFCQNNFEETFPELLLPLRNEVKNVFINEKYSHEYLVEVIDRIAVDQMSIEIRAELITQLVEIIDLKSESNRFSLLINDHGDIISKNIVAFTPVRRSEEEFRIPRVVKVFIDFMNNELYDALFKRLENRFDKNEKDKKRELQRIIRSVVNIQPYDSNNVIERIITGTKDALNSITETNDRLTCIKEMVSALYKNFKNIENRQDKLKVKVPLINKIERIDDAENLFLSKSYPSGALTEIIYGKVLTQEEYLVNISYWSFENEEQTVVESFFLWLGVNKFSEIKTMPLRDNWKEKNYIDFLFNQDAEYSDDFNIGRISRDTTVTFISNFDKIILLPINNIILLILKDVHIRKNLEQNEENIQWSYNYWRVLTTAYSFVRYQFISSNIFTKYILEDGSDELNKLINDDYKIDYEFLGSYGINKTEVRSILIKLGAKESFNDLEPESIYEILKAIPEKDSTKKGTSTQTIYKLALESLVKHHSNINIPDNLLLFAKKGDAEDYTQIDEIYYSDNTILPKKILDTLYLLNLPKRSGEDNVERYFGVKSLRGFKIQVDTNSIKENYYNTEFKKLFESIKPYLLAYRLESPNLKKRVTDFDTKRKEANAIKHCKVTLVNDCCFSFSDKSNVPIEQKEYINIKDIFYYKDNSIISIESLRHDSIFCDAFAEMMCITFKVNDLKNDFRQILKNDLSDTIHLALQDLQKEKIEEAFSLLGISRLEIDFWKRIFEQKGKQFSEPIENSDALKCKLAEELSFTLPDDYMKIDFETFNNNESYNLIKKIAEELSLKIEQIVPNGIQIYHIQKFADTIRDLEHKFKQFLWYKLTSERECQSDFISILNKYNLEFNSIIENKIIQLGFQINIDYPMYLSEWIKEDFKIEIRNSVFNRYEIDNLYVDLLSKYSIDDTEIEDESIRSLLYFVDNSEAIEYYIKTHDLKAQKEDSNNQNNDKITGNIVDVSLSKSNKVFPIKGNGNTHGSWIHSKQSEGAKRRCGKAAELLVYNTLKKDYPAENVKWVSSNSTTPDKNDNLHYDILYKNKCNEWKYLEVKAISDGSFIISHSEKEMGLTEPDRYEMALVKEGDIYIVKDIFKFIIGESFENNSKFVAQAKDYVFSFDITELTKD